MLYACPILQPASTGIHNKPVGQPACCMHSFFCLSMVALWHPGAARISCFHLFCDRTSGKVARTSLSNWYRSHLGQWRFRARPLACRTLARSQTSAFSKRCSLQLSDGRWRTRHRRRLMRRFPAVSQSVLVCCRQARARAGKARSRSPWTPQTASRIQRPPSVKGLREPVFKSLCEELLQELLSEHRLRVSELREAQFCCLPLRCKC